MDETFPNEFSASAAESYLRRAATLVAATEAACFALSGSSPVPLVHIRPGSSTPEQRAAVLEAFQELARPCIERQKDGAIEVGSPDEHGRPQYCLILLLRDRDAVPRGFVAVIGRYRDREAAGKALAKLRVARWRGSKLQGPVGAAREVSKLSDSVLNDLFAPFAIEQYVRGLAVLIDATEAAGFALDGSSLVPLVHIRPDSTPEQRAESLDAFMTLARPCVEQGKDGAIEVGRPNAEGKPQFCLVLLLRDARGGPRALVTLIRRYKNTEMALRGLNMLRV